MSVRVLKPGALTTVQDAGRTGWRHLGVGAGGALDAFSARVANVLAGNGEDEAVLEITLAGPTLRIERGVRIAICGAAVDATAVDPRTGESHALPGWRTIALPAGMELRFGACRSGARAYLAFEGGLDLPPTLGSRATDVRGGFGGLDGRALRSGDRLALRELPGAPASMPLAIARGWLDPRPDLDFALPALAHAMPGAFATLSPLFDTVWTVSASSDRQGLRLEGPALAPADPRERVSSPVAPGTVQLPPDGRPIVLLGEAQTVGGYPVIAHIASADLPRLAQCRPGEAVRFAPIDRGGALARLRAQDARLERMRLAVAMQRRREARAASATI